MNTFELVSTQAKRSEYKIAVNFTRIPYQQIKATKEGMSRKRPRPMQVQRSLGRPGRKRRRLTARRTVTGMRTVPRTTGAINLTETKYFDSQRTSNAIVEANTWAGSEQDPSTLNTLFAPILGNAVNNRIGNRVFVRGIRIRGMIKISPEIDVTVGTDGSLMRLILYIDQQTNAAQSQGEEVIGDSTAANADLSMMNFRNLDSFGRFRILKDRTFRLQNPSITTDGTNLELNGLVQFFRINVRFRDPIEVNFNATNGGTVADIVNNSFHLIAAKSGSSEAAVLIYNARIAYIDV